MTNVQVFEVAAGDTSLAITTPEGEHTTFSIPGTGSTPSVTGATVNGNVAKFIDTTGGLADAGVAVSALSTYTGPTVVGNFSKYNSTSGQEIDSGIAATAVQLKANIRALQASYGGGSTTFTIAVSGLTAASVAYVQFMTKINPSVINNVVAGTNVINVTVSADPGASTFNVIAFLAAQ